jgi:acyl-CoA reductase-like NAD-dependent aldehyde dehydrogenase
MSIPDKAQAHALLIDGQEVQTSATRVVHDPATGEPIAEVAVLDRMAELLEEHTAVKHVVFELTGAPRKEWYDAVSTPE